MSNQYKSEIVVVGAGIAGLVTTYELLQAGKKVLLLDRDTANNIGGSAKWALGGLFFVNTSYQRKAGIQDSIDLAIKDWFSFAEFEDTEVWGKQWAEQYIHYCTPHGHDWLRKQGIKFMPVVNWVERGLYQPGNSVPRFHLILGTGYELAQNIAAKLQPYLENGQLQTYFEHRATELLIENQVVKGVRGTVETTDVPFEALGEQVVLASGGINGSIERLKANWHPDLGNPPDTLLTGANQYAIGDLHDATTAINGNVTNLNKQWNYAAGIPHYKPRFKHHGLSLIPSKSALWLNYEGRRFESMPLITGFDTRYLVQRICHEPVQYSWQVLNMKIAKREFAISGSEHNQLLKEKKFLKVVLQTLLGSDALANKLIQESKHVLTANSVGELVEKMNAITTEKAVQQKYVEAAIQHYDGQISRGKKYHNDEQLRRIAHARQYRADRLRTCNFQKILDSKAMPLIAIQEFILARKSLGGIQTNLNCEVLTKPDANGAQRSIPGLYAVGEAAGFGGGGIHGHRSLEGTFLGGCVITGRIAAATICGRTLA